MGKKDGRLNEIGVSSQGEKMTIVRYGGALDIDVQFDDGTIVEHRYYRAFKKGSIRNPMSPSMYGIGFIGIGDFKSRDKNGEHTKSYDAWRGMYQRCYDPKFHERYSTYKNCKVCEEWNNYQNYAKWHNENYYEIENERMMLDKDILCKGNKVYSPYTCVFVPQCINELFVKHDKARGDYPIGVCKYGNKFVAKLRKDNKLIHLGTFNTPEEAFQAYKIAKEQYIKEVAEEYKDKIDHRLYEALMNYEVEIDD